ncbi:MAG: hypothetical protein IJS28_10450 [Synergistaceae bacterium]|nr:hypothetical protein [Synergistaceae bacterium]
MKRYVSLFLIVLMFCVLVSSGCGGGGGSYIDDPEQTESLNEDTEGYDPEDDGRGASGSTVNLSTLTADYTAQDGETLTGTLGSEISLSLADGATVILLNAKIEATSTWKALNGITCNGNATIIIEGNNIVKGYGVYGTAGIYVPSGKTLTIKGSGSLDVTGPRYGAGIGGAYIPGSAMRKIHQKSIACGHIVIEDGNITVRGGDGAAGIGCGYLSWCDGVTITGGTVTAIGKTHFDYHGEEEPGAAIGASYWGECRSVTIADTVTKVTAIKGEYAYNSIEANIVTIGGKVTGNISTSPYTYKGRIDLSAITENYTAQDGDTLTGKLGANAKISIADGATVTIKDVTINGVDDQSCKWAGLNCLGDATIILEGTNSVKGFHSYSPGIHVVEGKTLTIKGSGSLYASSTGWAAGIGGGSFISCGNIAIEGGTITAADGNWAAGIGGGYGASCGTITIKDTVTKVTATKGRSASYSIGAGYGSICGTVTIGGQVTGSISQSPYTYQP